MSKLHEATPADCLRAALHTGGTIFTIDEFSLNYRIIELDESQGGGQVTIPDISLVIPSTDFLDTADPTTGLRGLRGQPQPEKVMRLWADDLLTVSHDDAWVFLLNSTYPFGDEWIGTMFPKRKRPKFTATICVVGIYFDTLPPAGLRSFEDEMLTPNAIFNVEDCRSVLHP